jgi:GNAT superfamily N-acetyltransferase
MHFQAIESTQYPAVRQFLSEAGWAERVSDPTIFQKMMDRADRTIVVWEAGQVIGFGRALCDDVSNGYLSMVAVAPEWRGQGIGSRIVQRLIGDDPAITWVVRAGRESSVFWERQGFKISQIAMERPRSNIT